MNIRLKSVAAFTLVELMVVLAVLIALAGMVIPMLGGTVATSQIQTTQASLSALRATIMGSASSPGYWGDLRQTPQTMADLFIVPTYLSSTLQTFDRNTGRGWRGPYVQNSTGTYLEDVPHGFLKYTVGIPGSGYGVTGDPAVMDAWNHPIVIQIPTVDTNGLPLTPDQQSLFTRLVSAGPDGQITTPGNVSYPANNTATRGDDIVVFLRRADIP